jgi:hypothetical protein
MTVRGEDAELNRSRRASLIRQSLTSDGRSEFAISARDTCPLGAIVIRIIVRPAAVVVPALPHLRKRGIAAANTLFMSSELRVSS